MCAACPACQLSCLSTAVVTNISQAGDTVTVTTDNGTQLTADYVIVTAPLGVLKQGSIGFQPPLPADKQAAIREMVGKQLLLCVSRSCGWMWSTAGATAIGNAAIQAAAVCQAAPAGPEAAAVADTVICVHRAHGPSVSLLLLLLPFLLLLLLLLRHCGCCHHNRRAWVCLTRSCWCSGHRTYFGTETLTLSST